MININDVKIRRFQNEDFEDVMYIESESFAEKNPFTYMYFYEIQGDMFLVAQYFDYVVGFIVGYKTYENEGRIFSLAIREGFQRQGIGTMLLNSLFEIFNSNFLKFATLEVRKSNIRARNLYYKIGFIPYWIEKNYYSDGEDGIIMKLKLTSYKYNELEELIKKLDELQP